MPALYPGGDVTYLGLYAELTQLGFVHGREFRRHSGGSMGWYFAVTDEAYQEWLAHRGGSAPDTAPQTESAVDETGTGSDAEAGEAVGEVTGDSAVAPRPGSQRRSAKKGRQE